MVFEEEIAFFCCDWNEEFYGGECEYDRNCCWGSRDLEMKKLEICSKVVTQENRE